MSKENKLVEILTTIPLVEEECAEMDPRVDPSFLYPSLGSRLILRLDFSTSLMLKTMSFQGHCQPTFSKHRSKASSSRAAPRRGNLLWIAGLQTSMSSTDETLLNAIFSSCHLISANYQNNAKYKVLFSKTRTRKEDSFAWDNM